VKLINQAELAKKGGAPSQLPLRRSKGEAHDGHEAQAAHAARQLEAAGAIRTPQAQAATSSSVAAPGQALQRQCACGSGACSGCAAGASIDEARRPGTTSSASTRTTVVSQDGDIETRTQALGGPSNNPAPVANADHCALSVATFTSIPSGSLTAKLAGSRLEAPFVMRATFDNAIPCTCVNGEYRQFVRGAFTANGSAVTHTLAPGRTLNATTFQEDGDPAGGTAYGYRSQLGTHSRYLPDQQTGCKYEGEDAPGIGAKPGTVVTMNLDFIGNLIDTAAGNRVVTTSAWTVAGSATIP
jgi:hypothetical protein